MRKTSKLLLSLSLFMVLVIAVPLVLALGNAGAFIHNTISFKVTDIEGVFAYRIDGNKTNEYDVPYTQVFESKYNPTHDRYDVNINTAQNTGNNKIEAGQEENEIKISNPKGLMFDNYIGEGDKKRITYSFMFVNLGEIPVSVSARFIEDHFGKTKDDFNARGVEIGWRYEVSETNKTLDQLTPTAIPNIFGEITDDQMFDAGAVGSVLELGVEVPALAKLNDTHYSVNFIVIELIMILNDNSNNSDSDKVDLGIQLEITQSVNS